MALEHDLRPRPLVGISIHDAIRVNQVVHCRENVDITGCLPWLWVTEMKVAQFQQSKGKLIEQNLTFLLSPLQHSKIPASSQNIPPSDQDSWV